MIAAVVRGQAPDTLLARLQDTLETIHLQFSAPLADFDGDTSPLAGVRPLLEECLATVVATGRERAGRRAAWLPWAIAAGLAVLLLGGLAWRSHQRWTRAVAQLARSRASCWCGRSVAAAGASPASGIPWPPIPGRPCRGRGGYRDGRAALGALPLLQPQLVQARARAALSPPASVTLVLAGDTLRVGGSASLRWFAATARATGLPAGIAALDLSGVTPDIPPELASRVAEVERERDPVRSRLRGARWPGAGGADASGGGPGPGADGGRRARGERHNRAGGPDRPYRYRRGQSDSQPGAGGDGARRPGRAWHFSRRRAGQRPGHDPAARPGRSRPQPERLVHSEPQMIQKKVCMVGLFGTGKTSLVQRFVHSIFSERYLSTVGVKIDRKVVELDGASVTLILWDLAGRDAQEDITTSYLRGAHAILYVADGTRRETCDQLPELRALVREAAGEVPEVVALNKSDLKDRWAITDADEQGLASAFDVVRTSAKTGEGVEDTFQRIARATLATREARP